MKQRFQNIQARRQLFNDQMIADLAALRDQRKTENDVGLTGLFISKAEIEALGPIEVKSMDLIEADIAMMASYIASGMVSPVGANEDKRRQIADMSVDIVLRIVKTTRERLATNGQVIHSNKPKA